MKILSWSILLLLSVSLHAQEEIANRLLFQQYEKGVVHYKGGTIAELSMNYDRLLEKMCYFEPDGSVMALTKSSDIDYVTIGDRRFIPQKNDSFYEEIQDGKGTYYVQWKSALISGGQFVGYGYSTSAASTSVGYLSGQAAYLKANQQFEGKEENIFYLKDKAGKLKKINSAKALSKLFKGREKEIQQFATEQHIDFKKNEDVKRIVGYACGLVP